MIASMFWFAVMNNAIRHLSMELPAPVIVLMRNLLSLGIVTFLLSFQGWGAFRTQHPWRHFWRGGIGSISMQLWFYSLAIMPVAKATALSFTSPLFVTLFAIFFLKEKTDMARIAALLLGFAGTWVILHPGAETFDAEALIVLGSSSIMAIAGILIKTLTRTDPPLRIVFYMALVMTPFSLPFAIPYWQTPSSAAWGWAFAIALTSTFAHIFLAYAYRLADAVVIMPFDFARLIFSAAIAWFVFHEPMTQATFAGGAMITVSAVALAWRESRSRKIAMVDSSNEL